MPEESVGQQLRQAREARSLPLAEVATATHIRLKYLEALEADQFDRLPSQAQARGFVRMYANFLHLNANQLVAEMGGVTIPPPPEPETERAEAPEDLSPAGSQAAATFIDIGERLRKQRELLGLSLDDVVRHTHLRKHYLVALEAGDMNSLPSPVQGRGMLSIYATFLGMDPEPLLLRFADGLQKRLAARQDARKTSQTEAARNGENRTGPNEPEKPRRRATLPPVLRRLLSGELLLGGALGASLVLFLLWGAIRIFNLNAATTPEPTAPSIVDFLLATSTATTTFTPAPPSPTLPPDGAAIQPGDDETIVEEVTPSPPPLVGQGVNIYLTILQRVWMRVTVDDQVEFDGRVLPGSAYTFVGDRQVEILTGNGAGIQLFFNGQDQGQMGSYGEIVNRIYTRSGVVPPTPTVTPTPTATAPVTITPTPTATAGPGEATRPANP